MQLIGGTRFKLRHQVQVELSWPRHGMHQQAAAADIGGKRGQPGNHVLEQRGAEPMALVSEVDAQPGQQRYRLRVWAGRANRIARHAQVRSLRWAELESLRLTRHARSRSNRDGAGGG